MACGTGPIQYIFTYVHTSAYTNTSVFINLIKTKVS
jgi:hypothetical protein